jgi:ABC-2 type transport system ATP-binding protein
MNQPIISIKNLSKSYKDKKVIDDLNWEINKGDIIALLGRNGAGKSTLLESIMNLRDPQSGELTIWGDKWQDLSEIKRAKIGFVPQDTVGFEWMKVKQFLSYLGSFFPSWDKHYCDELRSRWNIDENQKVGDLSGGQSQILHVIQAISIKPELLILDEPVAHLDPAMRRQFISELVDLSCENNTTIIFSSHIISDLERVANKVVILNKGKISQNYEIDQLKSNIVHMKIKADKPLQQSEYYGELSSWHAYDKGATAKLLRPLQQSIEEFIQHAEHQIEISPLSLEDWYLEVSNESY